MNWVIAVGAVVLLGTTVVTVRGASANPPSPMPLASPTGAGPAPAGTTKQHPPASAPEESATISDDPTTAPDPAQSADNNVSFPTDI